MKYKKIVVGGTFDCFHDGHKALLRRAFVDGERVMLGICSDKMQELLRKDSAGVPPLAMRMWSVLDFLQKEGLLGRTEITVLEDPFGPAVEDVEVQAVVVSPESRERAEKLNEMRASKGLAPLDIVEIPFVLAEDGKPISSIRVRYGEMNGRGKILKPSRVP
ncbi:MAG TPA: pantetheine-phosphate adenylyltransferase [Hadesarchaea archaeon]|nr:pantetheine-phosphate adenylyltransferase [Hadesarchaea archaeon]